MVCARKRSQHSRTACDSGGTRHSGRRPGARQRLPSTRELARRFHVHPNTISAGYRQLTRERWVEYRRGSGVFVRANKPEMTASSGLALDQMVANLFRSARKAGVPQGVLRARLRQWLELQPPDHFLLIEPEEELRRIVASEIEQAVNTPVVSCGLEDCAKLVEGSIPVALPNRLTTVRQALPDGTEVLELHFRSVTSSLAEWLPAPSGALVGVASSWPDSSSWRAPCSVPQASIPTAWCSAMRANRTGSGIETDGRRGV